MQHSGKVTLYDDDVGRFVCPSVANVSDQLAFGRGSRCSGCIDAVVVGESSTSLKYTYTFRPTVSTVFRSTHMLWYRPVHCPQIILRHWTRCQAVSHDATIGYVAGARGVYPPLRPWSKISPPLGLPSFFPPSFSSLPRLSPLSLHSFRDTNPLIPSPHPLLFPVLVTSTGVSPTGKFIKSR